MESEIAYIVTEYQVPTLICLVLGFYWMNRRISDLEKKHSARYKRVWDKIDIEEEKVQKLQLGMLEISLTAKHSKDIGDILDALKGGK